MSKVSNVTIVLLAILCVFSQTYISAEIRPRSDVPTQDLWKLEDLYTSDEAWDQARQKLAAQFEDILAYKGKVTETATGLLTCLELESRFAKEFGRLYSYASMKSDEDTSNSKYIGTKQQLQQNITDYGSMASFIEPEIAKTDRAAIEKLIKQKPGLKIYRMYLDNIQRTKAHRLGEKEEKILAETALMSGAASSIYSIFSNAELPYPTITLSDGTAAELNKAGYSQYRAVTSRKDREAVFAAFWKVFSEFKGTFGVQLYSNVKKDMFYARTRNYGSSLHSALDRNNIPTEVYLALIKNVNDNLDSFHRYLKLKKRMLGVEQLKYSDIYAPVVKGVDLKYTIEEAKELVLDSCKPMGKDYMQVVKHAFANRWIDIYPTPHKRSGAYSNGGAYDVHPYILLNYNGQYEDVSTLAHELGHTIHSYYSNKNQPFPTADYSIFVAEVASTFNEALLIDKMLSEIEDDDVKLSLLMNYLDGLKGTVFRQTQFAEFELRIHQKAEAGEPLTGDELTRLYGEIVRKYYGHDDGICLVDDAYTVEWAYIPHFYYNFYVYQYATSFTASTALAQKVLDKETGAVEKYLKFISSGGSKYPIDLLKEAGVDMTGSEPFNKTMQAMNRTMDRIENILKKKRG